MLDTSTLISCTGKITRAELAQVPTPSATATHIPIPHAAVVEALVDTLSHRQISAVDEEFAVSRNIMEMFGVLDLATSFDGCRSRHNRFAIGFLKSQRVKEMQFATHLPAGDVPLRGSRPVSTSGRSLLVRAVTGYCYLNNR